MEIADALRPLRYHQDVVDYLRAEEPGLWSWYASQRARVELADEIRLEILKTAYRLEPAAHPEVYAIAGEALRRLGLARPEPLPDPNPPPPPQQPPPPGEATTPSAPEAAPPPRPVPASAPAAPPLTIYQSQEAGAMNASLAYLPGELHLILAGPVLASLGPVEKLAVFAHEFAHFALWECGEAAFYVAERILHAMAGHPQVEPSHLRTAQLFDLYAELFADRAALFVTGDPLATISSLVKIETGLTEVSAESYLRQAEEIFRKEDVQTRAASHPETFIRAFAVKAWSESPASAEGRIAPLLEGRLAMDALDLLGQRRLTSWTRNFLEKLLAAPALRTEPMLAYAKLFFDDFDAGDRPTAFADAPAPSAARTGAESLNGLCLEDPGLRDYVCYLLLDFATADPTLEDAPLVAGFALAESLGLGDRLQELAAKELKRRKRALDQARKAGATAAAAGPTGTA
ncbi:MAG: hypothetical protein HYZ53_29955 [Planctomycetes bacterium]|nr:hypothetical protein [Planctomycetota bacterium]